MPPWPPAETSGPFLGERRLTREQILLLAAWADAGAPEGQFKGQPAHEETSAPGEWQLGRPDLILEAQSSFTLAESGPDVFWNFVLHPDLKEPRIVRAIEIRPGNAQLFHHANLLVDRTGVSSRLEVKPGAGFSGMEFDLGRSPLDPVSHFLFWKPGTLPYEEPSGFGWRLNPGNLLVLNTHLQPAGKPERVVPKIGLYFTNEQPTHFPLVLELSNDHALAIPPGARRFTVRDEFILPADADVLAIYPHAHYLGTVLDADAILPGGRRKELIRIPHWDLNWQAVYRYRDPVYLPKGTRIRTRFCYDNSSANSRNPFRPPHRVRAGNAATDEMAHLGLQLLPRGEGDRRRTFTEAFARYRLAKDPSDVAAHLSLGAILLSRLRASEALSELRSAVALDPTRPEAHDMLGAALQNTGQLNEAVAEYRRALTAEPSYASARYNLARALLKLGQPEQAWEELAQVHAAFPNDARIGAEYRELSDRLRK